MAAVVSAFEARGCRVELHRRFAPATLGDPAHVPPGNDVLLYRISLP
jgi:hypothetical protein